MKTIIYPYRIYSKSARTLSARVGTKLVFPDRNYRPRPDHLIVNWGSSLTPKWYNNNWYRFLNPPENVRNATNKIKTFQMLEENGIAIPKFTTSIDTARTYGTVVVRNTVMGTKGEGIELVTDKNLLPPAPLYTELIDGKAEYRVHVFGDEVIDYIKKRRYNDNPVQSYEQHHIRSHNNGWIFARNNLKRLERVEDIAKQSIRALNLDFGSVDIIMDMDRQVYVLEVNTASGIEGTTVEKYLEAINKIYAR